MCATASLSIPGADLLTYGMGENIMIRLAKLLDRGIPISKIRDLRGTVYLASADERLHYESVGGWSIDELRTDRALYAEAFATQYRENDNIRGRAVTERYGDRILVQNPPMPPLEREELDRVYALPYERTYHPSYEAEGGIPAIREVRFSITHNRGCFGGCAFCAIAYHQGRAVRSRSIDSVVREASCCQSSRISKGYIHDVGVLRQISAVPHASGSSSTVSARIAAALRRLRARTSSPITANISSCCSVWRVYPA